MFRMRATIRRSSLETAQPSRPLHTHPPRAAGRALFRRQAGAAATAASRILLREGDAVLGVVHEGRLIAKSSDVTLSHAEFVRRTVGILPEGAEAVTIGKFQGEITVLRSAKIHGRAMPASQEALDAARTVFQ